jgi:hypothetical protein
MLDLINVFFEIRKNTWYRFCLDFVVLSELLIMNDQLYVLVSILDKLFFNVDQSMIQILPLLPNFESLFENMNWSVVVEFIHAIFAIVSFFT